MAEDHETDEKPEPTADERQASEVEELLGEACDKGYRLAIHRTDPPWCAGYLETWNLDGPISLDALRDAWGGRRFRLKILGEKSRYIRDFVVSIDDIPRRRGIPINPNGTEFDRDKTEVSAPPAPSIDLAGILDRVSQQQQRAEDRIFSLMEKVFEHRSPAPATAPAPAADPLTGARQLGELIEIAKNLSGSFEKAPDAGMLDGLIKLMEMKTASDKSQAGRQRPPPGRPGQAQRRQIPPPPGQPPPAAPPGQQPAPPGQQPQGGEQAEQLAEEDSPDPVDVLSQYEPADAGVAIRDYLDSLDPEGARAALSALVGQTLTLDDLSTLRAQSARAAADTSSDDHGPPDPAE